MFRHLLPVCQPTAAGGGHFLRRLLSVSETAVALRPFIFTIHPDLFGQFPKERAINEESLKQLNEYVNRLHGNLKSSPLTLTFFVRSRDTSPNVKFRPVRIHLSAQSPSEAIKVILSACDLPLDYLDNVSTRQSSATTSRPSADDEVDQFSRMVYSRINNRFHAKHAYDQSPIRMRRMARDNVIDWLRKNTDRARHNNLHIAPVRKEILKLKEEIKQETGLVEIHWKCDWTLSSFRTALRGLSRVCRQHSSTINLKGRTLVFDNSMGVSIEGHVVLRHEDIADNWIVGLRSLQEHDTYLSRIPPAERHLSSLLGNADIVKHPDYPVTMAQEYLSQVVRLSDGIRKHMDSSGERIKDRLDDVQLIVVCISDCSLLLSEFGQLVIPSSSSAASIISFINSRASQAKLKRQEYLKYEQSCLQTMQQCYTSLGVEALLRDANISMQQMESCCRRLLNLYDSGLLDVDLTVCRLKIAQFYSVMSDGDICIPWNFEE